MPKIADHLGTLISIDCKNFEPKEKTIQNIIIKTKIGQS